MNMDLNDFVDSNDSMFDFISSSEEEKNDRIYYLDKVLCKKLKTELYIDFKPLKESFFKEIKFPDYKLNSNALLGIKNNKYEFCLCECYKEIHHKHNNVGYWVSFGSIRNPKLCLPEFVIKNKKAAILKNKLSLINSVLACLFVGIIIGIFAYNLPLFKEQTEVLIVFSSMMVVFVAVVVLILYKIFIPNVNILYQINNQDIFGIGNSDFKNKYIILKEKSSLNDISIFRKTFNYDTCSKLLKIKPEITSFISKGNCFIFDFDDKPLDEVLAEKYINQMVGTVQAFEIEA